MIAVVIPSFRVKEYILPLINQVGKEVEKIYVVDDACPDHTGLHVENHCRDPRVKVLFHERNRGVGGAMKTGYKAALANKASVVVKLDGDGQMDPRLIPYLVRAIQSEEADYIKGNRFYSLSFLKEMPLNRRFGNSIISFLTKMITGYWHVMDPANGFTAITANTLRMLPLDKLDDRFFFETDLLFRLNTIRALVVDFPMPARYSGEKSNLSLFQVMMAFPFKYLSRFFKRIGYNYFLRDFNIGSFELLLGIILMTFGGIFGVVKWSESIITSQPASAGTVLLAGLPIILGFQSLLAFLHFDLINIPRKSISHDFPDFDLDPISPGS